MVVRKTTDTAMQKIKLSQICTDGGTQMRQNIDSDVVTAYADEIKNKARFPPVDLFYDGEEYWLADGFHRFHGAHAAEKKHINANIHDGGKRDAVLFAVGANAAHGLRRTNADKRRAVTTLLEDKKWSNWSDRTIAKRCGVSNPFVSSVRNELLTVNSSQPVVIATEGEDGKIRKRSASEKRKTISDRSCAPDDIQDAKPAVEGPCQATHNGGTSGDGSGGHVSVDEEPGPSGCDEKTLPATPPTRAAKEDYLNQLTMPELCEAIRAIDGDDRAKAKELVALARELDPEVDALLTLKREAPAAEDDVLWDELTAFICELNMKEEGISRPITQRFTAEIAEAVERVDARDIRAALHNGRQEKLAEQKKKFFVYLNRTVTSASQAGGLGEKGAVTND